MQKIVWCVFLTCLLAAACVAAERYPAPPPAAQAQGYIADQMRTLEQIAAEEQPLATHKLRFSAEMNYANGGWIWKHHVALSTVIAYVDALKAAGVDRIDVNPDIDSWANNDQAAIAEYDALFKHVRDVGLGLAINPEFNKNTDMKSFEAWSAAAMRAYTTIAQRYHPEIFAVIHEPTTMAHRLQARISPEQWVQFIHEGARRIKAASPQTQLTVGFDYREDRFFQAIVGLPELDFVSFDIYHIETLPRFHAWIQQARAAGKRVYMEETWRNTGSGDEQDVGNAAFQDLDIAWLRTLTVWASAEGLEVVTPFNTRSFFKYVAQGGGGFTPEWNQQVRAAIDAGQRTRCYAAFQQLIQQYR